MPITWTPELDRALYQIVEQNPLKQEGGTFTWADRAALLASQTQQAITEDMARNRYARILEAIELAKLEPPEPPGIAIPARPEGDFVGFTMAFYDIESDGLNGWGHEITCASITDNFGKTYSRTKFDFDQRNVLDDMELVIWLRDELEKYDILVGWYGTMFDLPFMNAKLIEYGQRPIRDMMYLDPCYKTRGGRYGLKVGSSKLKNVAKWLKTPNQKPEVEWETFKLAAIGDPVALAEVVDRCEADTKVMRDIFHHIKPMVRSLHR